jgi:hypothetical protein
MPTPLYIPDMADPADLPLMLWLKEVPARAAGRGLGLAAGDILLAVNGRAFTGTPAHLAMRLAERGGKPLALTFQRGPNRLTVLVERADLGVWDSMAGAVIPEGDMPRIDPDSLSNWEIMRDGQGRFDAVCLGPSLLATLLPPLWLLQMRLWVPFATMVTALAVAGAVSPYAVPLVWAALGVHLRRAGSAYLRADRRGRGLRFQSVHAARSETAAQEAHLTNFPNDRSFFAPEPLPEVQAI